MRENVFGGKWSWEKNEVGWTDKAESLGRGGLKGWTLGSVSG